MTASNPFHAAALEALANNISVVPTRMDGSKAPFGSWKRYMQERPSRAEVDGWFADGLQTGVFIICGAASGNLEMFEAESEPLFRAYSAAARDAGVGDLWSRVVGGYLSESPGGSHHVMWRCSDIAGNTKLASRSKRPEEMQHEKDLVQVLFETRGQGGGSVEPPSNGRVHPSGGRYTQIQGGFASISTITPEERDDLLNLARTFDQMPQSPPREPQGRKPADGPRPGDDFNSRTDLLELMTRHGWTYVYSRGQVMHLRRPGKDHGISATINHAGSGLLYVFTSSTAFEAHRSYTAFGAYAVLEHGGNFAEAARALRADGYGPSLQTEPVRSQPPPLDDDVPEDETPAPRERPEIDATDQHLERISAKVWSAIVAANDPPRLFTYGGLPSRITRTDDGGPAAQVLNEDRLGHEAARYVFFFKDTERQGVKHAAPPARVIRDMLAFPEYPLPPLVSITEAPTFAPDGSFSTTPGYHPAGRTYYAPAAGFTVPPVPMDPTQPEIDQARALLVEELFGDFPFTGQAERAHAIVMLLLPLLRGLVPGPTPLHLIEKPTAGTGASLLADVVMRVATGRPVGAMTEGRDEDEWRKRLTAKLRGAPPIILIDNLRRRLDSAVVSSALTAHHIEDRILGTSENIRLPVRCTWIASGNNPALSSEITRRTLRIRLDAKQDRPWLREAFRHYPLLPWVMAERPQLVAACLTLGRAWIAAGKPVPVGAPLLGSFEDWSYVMAGVLDVAGVPGFLTNLDEFYEASDTEGSDIRQFLFAWWEQHKDTAVGVADLYSLATVDTSALDLGDKGERSQKIRLGKMLSDLRDRHYQIADGLTVRVAAGRVEHKVQLWRLIAPTSYVQGDVEYMGDVSHSAHAKPHFENSVDINTSYGEKHPPHPSNPPFGDEGDKAPPDSWQQSDSGFDVPLDEEYDPWTD